jgi:hypothetical protein
MRKALEEDQYSANGSIVDTESDDEEHQYVYKGQSIRLDRNYLVQAARKHLWLEARNASIGGGTGVPPGSGGMINGCDLDDAETRRAGRKKKKKGKRGKEDERGMLSSKNGSDDSGLSSGIGGTGSSGNDEYERDEGSIFGQTTGSSNSTWVECDKCKKVRNNTTSCVRIY